VQDPTWLLIQSHRFLWIIGNMLNIGKNQTCLDMSKSDGLGKEEFDNNLYGMRESGMIVRE
jgi:hypothetical protein